MKIALSVSEKEKAKGAGSPYFKAMLAAGAKAEELTLISAADARRVRADDFDGVLFAGGEDVDPEFYGEEKKYENVAVNRARDEFEFKLLDRSMDRRLPIFGICRGTQMINVKFGGTLYQDLASDAPTESEHKQSGSRGATSHQVTLTDPESQLGGVFEGSCRVNSLHHQAIKRLGHGLKVTAHSEDGLVEAVEAADGYPLLAVQWHPEELVAEHEEQRRLLAQFIAQCRERSEKSAAKSHKAE
jgi:putative glutamine amidotransferase